MTLPAPSIRAVCFDWGGTLMSEDGPPTLAMADWSHVRCIDGARETLEALHGAYPLCVATNAAVSGREEVERALQRGGLLPYFSHVFCAGELGCGKEDPRFWATVARTLDVSLPEIAMVGDNLVPDVLAPAQLGIFAVWFNEGGRRPAASPEIRVVHALPEFVRLVKEGPNR